MIHYSVIAMPEECFDIAKQIDDEEYYSDFDIRYAYNHEGVDYYSVHDYDEMIVRYSEDLAEAGVPHNVYPLKLDELICVVRFTPQGGLIDLWSEYADYLSNKCDGTTSGESYEKLLKYEDDWDNQLHYGRIHALKQQIEGK